MLKKPRKPLTLKQGVALTGILYLWALGSSHTWELMQQGAVSDKFFTAAVDACMKKHRPSLDAEQAHTFERGASNWVPVWPPFTLVLRDSLLEDEQCLRSFYQGDSGTHVRLKLVGAAPSDGVRATLDIPPS